MPTITRPRFFRKVRNDLTGAATKTAPNAACKIPASRRSNGMRRDFLREHHSRTSTEAPNAVHLGDQVRYTELTEAYLRHRQETLQLSVRVKHLERSLVALSRARSMRRFGLSIDDQIHSVEFELADRQEELWEMFEYQRYLAEEISAIGRF